MVHNVLVSWCLTINVLLTTIANVLFRLKARGQEAHQHRVFAKTAGKSEHMKKIQPTGPYNLVGISWGGILAIEIARELMSQEQIFQLFLLDGVPETILNIIKQLGKGDQLQFNLISSYKPSETLLSGNVHLIQREGASQEDTCQLDKGFSHLLPQEDRKE
ncbi:unnamed protein product [Timema podura]|uniref:oleoyl-[acyl-carrier-protein] hydrolase n=1 Tax=Timema podura TaxID=61482 RepID=A0ABN7NGW1_TIMPD|nr:unnamed protein product [Timema podura]